MSWPLRLEPGLSIPCLLHSSLPCCVRGLPYPPATAGLSRWELLAEVRLPS